MKTLSTVDMTAGEPLKATLRATLHPQRNPCWAVARRLATLMATLVGLVAGADAASVGSAGYTHDFAVRPVAADFSTSSGIAGGAGDITSAAALDAYVQNVTATSITAQVTATLSSLSAS